MMNEVKVIKTPELEIQVLPNGIHIYKLANWSYEGLNQWETSVTSRLDQPAGPVLSIYDMRHMNTVSREAFNITTRIFAHPNIDNAFSAAVITNQRVAVLVNVLIQMRRNGEHNRILSDIDKAIGWLSQKA